MHPACICDEICRHDHAEALNRNSDKLRKFRLGDTNEGCGGGIHHLVDRLQSENAELVKKIEELRREREAIKDALKKTGGLAVLIEIERIVYMGSPP